MDKGKELLVGTYQRVTSVLGAGYMGVLIDSSAVDAWGMWTLVYNLFPMFKVTVSRVFLTPKQQQVVVE